MCVFTAQCALASVPTGIPPSNGQYQGGTAPHFPVDSGTAFTVVCDTNYQLVGTGTFTCTDVNTWDSTTAPMCVRKYILLFVILGCIMYVFISLLYSC